ncbi:MAG: ABC transporter substrate-binding protein [Acidimicrobiia bacterium]|nr:ABC transporter substrate-binding protein [Acidimicrobiia bacterium]MYC45183.1 ABC transporter substrate-binding protein [Acidimicrobiia bacterium]
MSKFNKSARLPFSLLAALLCVILVAAACGEDDGATAPTATTAADTPAATEGPAETDALEPTDMAHLGDGSLGTVRVEAGDAIQIRSLNAISGDVAFFGLPIERSVVLAIRDYGQIKGFDVDLGTTLDDLCSNDGGQAAAQTVVADDQVVGVIGTSCSGAAVAAAPLIGAAGMTMISGGNTSPALTSDLAGNAGPNYSEGYYRTAHNDLFQGAAMAEFVFNELGITTAAAIHDGDPYTQGLAQAFTDAYAALGGDVTGFSAVNKDDTDMVPVLTEVAAGSPGALFFPIFQPAGDFIADQAPGVAGLENTVLLAADGLLNTNYLSLPQTVGMYFSGPDQRFGDNVNQSTGKSAVDFLAAYEADYGERPAAPFWAHGYDATTLLLDAIDAASYLDGDTLVVDRQGVREFLNNVEGYSGLIGTINCDNFGDCGSSRITVIQNIGGEENAEASIDNVVFSFSPLGSAAEAGSIPPIELETPFGDGSLGTVRVEAGDAVQIRSLNAISGDVAFFGLPIERSVVLAIRDYGPVRGFDVDLGTTLDDLCSNDGGQAAAQTIVADEDVIGVIGTSCSGAAVAAAPLVTAAGMTMISGGNTSPALTSDLAGNAGPNYSVGYYRTAHNDLFQGAAMAEFVFNELGITTAAAIHDGDPYTQGLAQAFTDAYAALGGDVTGFSAVNKDDTDMVPVLTEVAAGSPGALFFPIFQPAGDFIADQAPGVAGLENTVLLAADGLLNTNYLSLPQTEGMYFSGPDQRFGDNVNQSTGKNANDFLAAYEADYGERPAAPFWAHGYDATAMLLDAIVAASWLDGDTLVIDRQGVRDYLNQLKGYSGLIGTINCDDFGDCGAARITVVQNIGGEANADASMENVVFSYAP